MASRFSSREINDFCLYLSREYGLSFPAARYSFVENRVLPVMTDFGCIALSDIVDKAKKDLQLRIELLNSLTTNETWFFRHPEHFKILRQHILPALLDGLKQTGDNRLHIWSAGCSIGAELYSILFTILDTLPDPQAFNIQLTGSDISSDAIGRARSATYNDHELRLLNEKMLAKYFKKSNHNSWQVLPEFQKHCTFELLNLLKSWPARTYNIIFCRNTMIYFDEGNKNKVATRFFRALEPGGFYVTSANEMLQTLEHPEFTQIYVENEIVYRKTIQSNELKLVKFKTPTDLLRALNLLKNNGFYFQLEKIPQEHSLAPRRAIYLHKKESAKVEELFALNSIKVASSRLIVK
jgi:chemotaxis protein methyltransferase CheR